MSQRAYDMCAGTAPEGPIAAMAARRGERPEKRIETSTIMTIMSWADLASNAIEKR